MNRWIFLGLAGGALFGCYLGAGQSQDSGARDSRAAGEDGSTRPGGLPCPVASLFTTFCATCHGASPSSGISLASYADLTRSAKSDPTKIEAQLALARMKSGSMPPQGSSAPGTQEIGAFEAWVSAGLPQGSCGGLGDGGAPNPFVGPHVCTSNTFYSGGEGQTMEPGNACIGCHATTREAPRWSIAGTVYPTGHEPSRCEATGVAGAQVTIVDKNGATYTYTANSVGNFMGTDSVALPFTAQVRYTGKVRAMSAPQMSGDCNACHTENGASGAPGRILLPN
jgi:cytochrome c553